jgi:hypothetical protein
MDHMQSKAGLAAGIMLSIVALLIGLAGIAILIGVGEAANNTVTAFAAVSFPFALLAGFLSWIVPGARWVIAAAMALPWRDRHSGFLVQRLLNARRHLDSCINLFGSLPGWAIETLKIGRPAHTAIVALHGSLSIKEQQVETLHPSLVGKGWLSPYREPVRYEG